MNKQLIAAGAYILILLLAMCFGVVNMIWMINNPKANQLTIYTHFDDAIHFRKLDKFQ